MDPAAQTAYLLVTHGSRDPRSQAGAAQLVEKLRQRFDLGPVGPEARPGAGAAQLGKGQIPGKIAAIAPAVLELGSLPLHQQIVQFAQQVSPLGVTGIKLLPLFLLPGVHVQEDLPEELRQAQALLLQASLDVSLELLPYIGAGAALQPVLQAQQQALRVRLSRPCLDRRHSDRRRSDQKQSLAEKSLEEALPGSPATMAGSCDRSAPASAIAPPPLLALGNIDWILVAHGSRRLGAAQSIERLAASLGARPAYWVGSPSLADCLQARGEDDQPWRTPPLGLLSYFLFEGGITDQLAQVLETAERDAPRGMSEPLAAFPAMVTVVAEAIAASLAT
jgi:sirohydrochlorin ferrochelatase